MAFPHRFVGALCMAIIAAGIIRSCQDAPKAPATAERIETQSLNTIAADFVTLALQFGKYDANYVDAFTGAQSVRDEAESNPLTLGELSDKADVLATRLEVLPAGAGNPDRLSLLKADVLAMQTRIAMARGETFSFDEETRRLYGVVAPQYTAAQFEAALKIAGPKETPVIIPRDKIQAVMQAAIAECRHRTLLHYALPAAERFDMELVTGKAWSAYNWYKGDYRSVIQINLDQPLEMNRVLDLGCHEGYPGHHVYNVMAERDRIKAKGWVENTVVPLYSPAGPLMEGSGNYGLELAFPGSEKDKFERETLFPLAGLEVPVPGAPKSAEVIAALRMLDFANIHAGREYLDGRMSREQAVAFLMKFNRDSESRARQRVDFFDTYRGYIINYALGEYVIADYVDTRVAAGEDQWDVFKEILDTPMTLQNLQPQ